MLISNGVRLSCNPMRLYGANSVLNDMLGNKVPGSARRNALTAYGPVAAIPYGHLHPGAWVLPNIPGGMSGVGAARIVFTADAAGALGVNITATTTLTITTDAVGQLIVSGSGTATFIITADGNVNAALLGSGTALLTITASGDVGAQANAEGTATITITASLTPYAIGHMQGIAAAGTELSPDSLAQSLLDLQDVETGLTVREALRLIAAATAGEVSGAATSTVTIRNAVADSKNRIVATVDGDGNRSAITYDLG